MDRVNHATEAAVPLERHALSGSLPDAVDVLCRERQCQCYHLRHTSPIRQPVTFQ